MTAQWWLCVVVELLLCDGVFCWYENNYRRARSQRAFSYPRDWDIDWTASQRRYWEPGNPVPEYNYGHQAGGSSSIALQPRVLTLPKERDKMETRGVWHSHQRGSAVVPHPGATVRVRPDKDASGKFYRGTVTSTISDESYSRRRGQRNYQKGNIAGGHQMFWEYSQDQPIYSHPKVCARCPSDRAVLAKRGANTVLMEVPPIIPCHPWSSVEKVKQDIVLGPKPGSEVPEGSHKIVIRLRHRRTTLATCVIRYNVIVRHCEDLALGPGVKASCPQGTAWGGGCNMSCDPGYLLEGDSYTECTDDLEWNGNLPQCITTTSCPLPTSPDNGRLSCRTPHHRPATVRGMLPDGSLCRYLCDTGYAVPSTQQHLTEVRCIAGNWDNHMDPVCVETNELDDEELPPEMIDPNSLSFDSTGCPEGFCKNGGRCIVILSSPMCSCISGYSGLFCEDISTNVTTTTVAQSPTTEPDPDESNSVT